MTWAYYNEHDRFAAAWLRELIAGGHIAPGEVDERDIRDVRADELLGFAQCHFFAGIGGWSFALRLAGWPDDRPVWTGSCPCQPFSAAGKQRGAADERHLWPDFLRLIAECSPATVFGEQVASRLGREWLTGVFADLEGVGYAVAGADLCAAGVGAPHIRQRLWWVGVADCAGREQGQQAAASARHGNPVVATGGAGEQMADADERIGRQGRAVDGGRHQGSDAVAWPGPCGSGDASRVGDASMSEKERQRRQCFSMEPEQEAGRPGDANAWSRAVFIGCADGKARRVEPGIFPLAHGVSARVGRLRGYGNAIVPQVAARFITSVMAARAAA